VSQTVSLRRLNLRRKGSKDNTSAAVSTSYRIQAYAILVAWFVLFAVFSLLLPEVFPTWQNVTSIANQKAATVLLTLGLVFALSAGEFDLSIGGAVSLGAAIPAWLATVAWHLATSCNFDRISFCSCIRIYQWPAQR
jgi:ribose/xylose/arabinose/galactoside ABC-type transport system permease subunit